MIDFETKPSKKDEDEDEDGLITELEKYLLS